MRSLSIMREVLQHHGNNLPRKVLRTWSEGGWRGLLAKSIDAFRLRPIDKTYSDWIRHYDALTEQGRQDIRDEVAEWNTPPLISLLMLIRHPDDSWLEATVRSICAQLYPYWELCICQNVLMQSAAATILVAAQNPRVRLIPCEVAGNTSKNLNALLAEARGEFIAVIECNDLIPEHALYWMVKEIIEHPETDAIFSDEDKVAPNGARFDPYFKSDWNPALMLSRDAFGQLGVFRKSLLEKVGGFRSDCEGSEGYDLVLRCAQAMRPEQIRHLPRVLYHRRDRATIEAEANAYSGNAGRRAIKEYLVSIGVCAAVSATRGCYQVAYTIAGPKPRISILVATTGAARLIEPCIQSIGNLTSYENFEVVLLVSERDRNAAAKVKLFDQLAAMPRVRVLAYRDQRFNYSWVNNWGVSQTSGDALCFLNDDTIVITPNWLEQLVARVLLPGVAAAGAMLFYPNDTIQHAGVILGLGGVAGHACHGLPRSNCGYFDRACLEQDVSCVTAACMMVRRSLFHELGGFDERLAIAYNDVDLCMRIRAAGWRIIFAPTVQLYHRESSSTGRHDSRERVEEFANEAALMRKRWGQLLDHDPYYSPNLSLRRQFDLAFPPRRPRGT